MTFIADVRIIELDSNGLLQLKNIDCSPLVNSHIREEGKLLVLDVVARHVLNLLNNDEIAKREIVDIEQFQ